MSDSPRLFVWSRRFIIGVVAGFLVLSIDWRPHPPLTPPTIIESLHASGALLAGAAKASIVPPFPTPIGGFATRGNTPFQGVAAPIFARAVVTQVGAVRLGFVSVELVVVPAPLRDKVRAAVADLKLNDVFIGATHTHAGVGGYWDKHIAAWLGIGAYDPKIEAFLVTQISMALHQAAGRLRPAKIAVGHIIASNYQINRDDPAVEPVKTLTGVRIDALDGQRIARMIVYAVHPTITPQYEMKLSGDWPSAMMTKIESDGAPALFFQGAVGDVTWGKRAGEMPPDERVIRFGRAVAGDAEGALGAGEGVSNVTLALGRVRIRLPPADASPVVWLPFERIASNVFQWLLRPGTTEVSYLRLGPLTMAMIPGEPVSQLGRDWHKLLGNATIVGLMDDYIGYIETPERVREKVGEAQRSYFGPSLAPLILQGLEAARQAADTVK